MLKFIRAGMYTSVQDGGREGQRQWGISRCGALDKPAMTIANLLVGTRFETLQIYLYNMRSTSGHYTSAVVMSYFLITLILTWLATRFNR